ncbi:arginine N-succinyltransferase [Sphingopyxis witflariensis]|uniref:Arginine N-succinyltransferase n=1 Tax=Sphingopyxis witflariensis TaxID=173675 RepID=A0A246JQL0_9SPHN|nr:arginine N-succinyltransferase [Sphingopyxis witflariensis]OWQ95285.1 arginine N-succinyltransferase [Sphingopyxis witflariensis]
MNYVIRAAKPGDLQSIYEMAKLTGGGFTNLPPDKKALRTKLDRTEASFASDREYPSDELYLLVLEDLDSGEVRGTCQIFGQVGQRWPFYSYRIGTDSKHSEQLDRTFHAQVLMLSNDLNGASEVGGLFLHPAARAGGLGLLLARSRYLFIARHRARFGDRILAELRGVIDEAGGSPFWDGVAGKFFGMSFQEADQFNAVHGNQFIADLMPKHPVYIAMLGDHARSVIGVPHPSGRAAMRMLENEGFAYENYVDIFDGGPTMTARTDQVASIRNARHVAVSAIADGSDDALVATGQLADFRCCFGQVSDGGTLDNHAAKLLKIAAGDEISWIGR